MNAKKHRLLKVLLPCMLALCLILAGVLFLINYEPYNLRSITKDPDAQIIKSFQKTKTILQNGMAFRVPDTFYQSLEAGSIEMSFSPEENTTIQNTLYLRDDNVTSIGTIKVDEEDPLTYGFWIGKENIVLDVPALYKNGAIGINIAKLKGDLKDSALLDVLGLDYEETVELLDVFLEMKPGSDNAGGKDWRSMLEMKKNLDALLSNCAVSVQKGELPTDMGPTDAYRVSYSMTSAQMCDALDILAKWVVSTEAYQSMTKDSPQAKEELFAEIAELKKQIVDSNAKMLTDFYLHKKTQAIIQTGLRIDWMEQKEAGTFQAVVKLGANPIESLHYTAEISMIRPGENKESILLDYERSHAHNLPGRKLTITADDETHTIMELQVNSVTNAFQLSLFEDGVKFSGVCKSDADTISMTLQFEDQTSVDLLFRAAAEAPGAPAYKNICAMERSELEDLFALFADEKETYIWIEPDDGDKDFRWVTNQYSNLGELLESEGIAILDENGRITVVIDYAEVSEWTVIVDDVKITDSLYDVYLPPESAVYIRNADLQDPAPT